MSGIVKDGGCCPTCYTELLADLEQLQVFCPNELCSESSGYWPLHPIRAEKLRKREEKNESRR